MECNICGSTPVGTGCYHICPNSVHYYSAEQEREDDRWSVTNRDHITEAYAATAKDAAMDDYDWKGSE